jgi:hypothetical protein
MTFDYSPSKKEKRIRRAARLTFDFYSSSELEIYLNELQNLLRDSQ